MSSETSITENTRSYFERPLSKKQFRVHSSAEEERDWARQNTRECRECKLNLPRSCFGYNTSSSWPFDRNGYLLRRPECNACNKKSNKTKRLAEKSAVQKGLPVKPPPGTQCELCSKTDSIVFDHSHSLCQFRGWLCNSCNRALGVLRDEPEHLIKAVEYSCGGDKLRFKRILETSLNNLSE
jgi:hypothetical protein